MKLIKTLSGWYGHNPQEPSESLGVNKASMGFPQYNPRGEFRRWDIARKGKRTEHPRDQSL